jgi:hypothetical protein
MKYNRVELIDKIWFPVAEMKIINSTNALLYEK